MTSYCGARGEIGNKEARSGRSSRVNSTVRNMNMKETHIYSDFTTCCHVGSLIPSSRWLLREVTQFPFLQKIELVLEKVTNLSMEQVNRKVRMRAWDHVDSFPCPVMQGVWSQSKIRWRTCSQNKKIHCWKPSHALVTFSEDDFSAGGFRFSLSGPCPKSDNETP